MLLAAGLLLSMILSSGDGTGHRVGARPLPIIFDREGCWTYRGGSDGFSFNAERGDRLVITAAGLGDFSDGTTSWKELEARDVVVSQERIAVSATTIIRPSPGKPIYEIPASAKYLITLGPVAIYGHPSIVAVCRAPRNSEAVAQRR